MRPAPSKRPSMPRPGHRWFVRRASLPQVGCAATLSACVGRTILSDPAAPTTCAAFDRRPAETLAIGDGVLTDVAGACRQGIDVLYGSGGIHASEYAGPPGTDVSRPAAFLQRHDFAPAAVIPALC